VAACSKIALGIAKALDHIHNSPAALIHRNVNPKAILLGCDNEPELTDFELVYDPAAYYTVMGEDNEDFLTPYTAPEVFRGAPDFKSDVYALGVTLYEMLAGHTPVRDFQALANAGGRLTEAHMNALPNDVPSPLKSLLRDMVTLEPLKCCTKKAFDPLRTASNKAAKASWARESLPQLIFVALHAANLGQLLKDVPFFCVRKTLLERSLFVADTVDPG